MKEFLEDIEETWKVKHIGPEKEILENFAEEYMSITKPYMIVIYTLWFLYCGPPVVINKIHQLLPTNETYTPEFLYRIEHVLNLDKYFNLLMLHAFIAVFYIITTVIAVDITFTMCILHICALFECLRYNIERIRGSDFVHLEPKIEDDKAYHDIINCIESYKHALKLSDILSANYSTAFLFILGNIVISLSFGAAELVMLDTQLEELIRIFSATMGQVLVIFYLSWISQKLIDYSSSFQNVIYSCDWYNISLRSKHLLKLTLLRAAHPCQVKGGKIYVMSLMTFSWILKGSLSYFTVLTSLQQE
ncbi:hypothetical protein PUN28_002096 [Cardiocondyla obscurior]